MQVRTWNDFAVSKFHADITECTCDAECTCGYVHNVVPISTPAIPVNILTPSSHTTEGHANAEAAKAFLKPHPNFDTIPRVATGTKTMLLRNISPHAHLMNGSIGTVSSIQFNEF